MVVKTAIERRYKPKHPFLSGGIAGGLEILATFPLELGAEFHISVRNVDGCSMFVGMVVSTAVMCK